MNEQIRIKMKRVTTRVVLTRTALYFLVGRNGTSSASLIPLIKFSKSGFMMCSRALNLRGRPPSFEDRLMMKTCSEFFAYAGGGKRESKDRTELARDITISV